MTDAACAEPLALAILRNPPEDLTLEQRDILHAELLRGRAARLPGFLVPLHDDRIRFEQWEAEILRKSYEEHAQRLRGLQESAESLGGAAQAIALSHVALAWYRLERDIATDNPAQWRKCGSRDDEVDCMMSVRRRCYGVYEEARRAKEQCRAKALAVAAEHLDWQQPLGMDGVAGSPWLRRNLWSMLPLFAVKIEPAPAPTVLRALVYAPWLSPLHREAPTSDGALEPLLDLALALVGGRLSASRALRAARSRIALAVRFGSSLQVDRVLALLATLTVVERTDEAHLLLAFALALRSALLKPAGGGEPLPDLRRLEAIAQGGDLMAARAVILAALFRANHAVEAIMDAVATKDMAQVLQQRPTLRSLGAACETIRERAAALPPPLSQLIESSVSLECRDTFYYFDSEITAAASILESGSSPY